MELHSSLEASPKQTCFSPSFHHFLSAAIALLTIAFPLYITSRYSSNAVINSTSALSTSAAAFPSPPKGSEKAN